MKRVLLIILSILIPPAGIIIGTVYMSRDSAAHRSFGKTILIISLVTFTLGVICCCGSYVFLYNYMTGLA